MKFTIFIPYVMIAGGITLAQTATPPEKLPGENRHIQRIDSIDAIAICPPEPNTPDTVCITDTTDWDAYFKTTMLDEIVVKGVQTAVVVKQDTIEYNAGSYKTAANAKVEDLLKKLPGVEVGSDGSVTSNGRSVTKILVNGKEFFDEDPTAATKNIPSEMVDKVQVVQRKSDLARLTGVDDGEEETVINLTVKRNMQDGWFGNVQAGYGTDGRYRYSFMVNRFSDGNQITLLGGGNNINEMGFSDRGRGRFGGFGGNNGINSSQHLGLNFNVGKSEAFRIGGDVMYSHSDRKTEETRNTQYLFPDSVSYLDSWQHTRDRGHNVGAMFRMQWKIDDANTLDFRPRFNFSSRDMERAETSDLFAGDPARTAVNKSDNRRKVRGNSYEASGNLIFNHNVLSHPGRSISVQGQYSFSDSRQNEYSWSRLLYYLLNDEDEDLFRYIDTHTWSSAVDARITWTEPIGDASRGNYLTFAYKMDYRWNNADKLTYSLDPSDYEGYLPAPPSDAPEGYEADPELSNRFRNQFFTQELQIGYKRVDSRYNLQAGIGISPASSSSEDLINDARNIPTRWVWNVAPFFNLRWKFDKSSSLRVNYRARTSQPSMSQLQPVADLSDPMNITVGNPTLKPSFSQSLMAHFNGFNRESQRSLSAMLSAGLTSNNVVSRTSTDSETGVRTTTYENMNGNWNLMAMGMLTQPFRNRAWRMNARLQARYSSVGGYIDNEKNRSGNLSLAPSAGVTFTHDVCQFSLSPTYSYQLSTATLSRQPDRSVHSYGFDASGALYLPFGLEVTTDLYMTKDAGYAQGYNTTQWLWNAQMSYSFLRDRSLSLSVSVYDILQMKKNITRSVSAASIVDARINDLTRYAMMTLTWNFNSFGKSKKMSGHDGEPGPPDAPRDGRPPFGGHDGPPDGGRRGQGHGGSPMRF